MSNILKGILNETSPHNYDSDWDYQDAVARSGKPRSSYRSQEDDTFDADVAYSKKMYQLAQKQKRDADHDRLATGTNESEKINPIGAFPIGPKSSRPNRPPLRTSAEMADMLNVDIYKFSRLAKIFPNFPKPVEGIRAKNGSKLYYNVPEFNKWVKDNDILTFLKQNVGESLDDPWGDQGNFAGDKPVNLGGVSIKNIQTGDTVKYLGQPSKVVAMSKDRKYSRITISKGMGTVTQDVLTSDLQQLGQGKAIEENDNIQTRMRMDDYYNLADAIQEKLKQAIKFGDKELIQKLNKERDDLDARVKKYGLIPESQLDEISNEKLSQYKTAAAADAGKADKEGDYKRGDKRFSGIVKATKKQFANDTKKSGISQGINEFSPGATGPKGPKDYGQPNSSRYIGGNKFVVGTTNNYVLTATIDKWGLEWDEDDEIWFLDSPGAAHIADASEGEIELPPPREQRNQIHDLVTDYLNARNSADLQKVAAYYGHSNDGEMATNESSEAPRFNSKQEVINHFVKNGKSAAAGAAAWERGYRGSSNKPIELKKPPQRSYHDELDDKRYSTFENLGDQLKSQSLEALQQIKQQIEQKRAEDLAQWEQDFRNSVANKMRNQPIRPPEATPVAQPGEKHSVLKARLSQLNSAIQKQELLDKLVDRLERKGLMTSAMQNDTDTRMHVRYGAKDNYQSLNKKLDKAIEMLQSRLNIRKISGLKEVHDERDEYDNHRQGRDYGKGNLFVDPGSNEFKKEVHIGSNDGERGRPKNLKGVSKALPADAFGRTTGKIPASARPTSKEDPFKDVDEDLDENLHKWFQEKWVRFGPDGKIRGDCARGDDSEGKPKCLPQNKAQNLGKKGRASAAARKRREDPNPERSGKAINVNTKNNTNEEQLNELFEPTLNYYTLSNGKMVQVSYRPNVNQSPVPFTDVEVSYVNPALKPQGGSFDSTGVASPWTNAPDGVKQSIQKFVARSQQGVAEEQLDELSCWFGYHRVAGTKAGFPDSCAKNKTNEEGLAEGSEQKMSVQDTLAYLKKVMGTESHEDWRNHIINTNEYFVLKDISVNSLKSDLSGLNKTNVEKYKQMDFSKAPPIVIGSNGNILDGYHRANVAKALKVPTLKAWVGVKKQSVAEAQHSESCPHCGGEMVSEELMNEKKDACYYKVKSRYKVWPSAYASGALVKCRKKGASNWGTGGKSNESIEEDQLDEKWTKKYKDSINCSNPKGFSQKAHCAGKQKNESAILQGLNQLDEGWKEKLGAAALTGAMALGAAGANARVTPGDDPNINRLTGKPNITQPVQTQTPTKAEAPKGFSKEYLQSVVNGTHPRPMISVEKAQELLKQGQ